MWPVVMLQSVANIFNSIVLFLAFAYKDLEKWILSKFPKYVKEFINKIFRNVGINIGGNECWDICVKNEDFYVRVCNHPTLGLGESYMDEWWECDKLDEFFHKIHMNKLYLAIQTNPMNQVFEFLTMRLFNLQTKSKSWEIAHTHYDLGNDLFEAFLDPSMNYSCGYWKNATDLNQAQLDKMELIGKKLLLKPGMKVLDIGCGWGGLVKYLAENFQVECVGITVSKEGAKIAQERCANYPIDIRVQDYRDVNEQFDRIVSVGMFEHVGEHNYRVYFESVNKCLKDEGLFLLHTIGVSHKYMCRTDLWIHKYIFTNSILPNTMSIPNAMDGLFILEDWHNFGYDYSLTLMAWYDNFNKAWPKLQAKYGDRFYRMWKYYLLMAAGIFRARCLHTWQVVLSKNGFPGGYHSVR